MQMFFFFFFSKVEVLEIIDICENKNFDLQTLYTLIFIAQLTGTRQNVENHNFWDVVFAVKQFGAFAGCSARLPIHSSCTNINSVTNIKD